MSVRLQNVTTGVTVEVSDETAANLSAAEWSPEKADEKPARRTSK